MSKSKPARRYIVLLTVFLYLTLACNATTRLLPAAPLVSTSEVLPSKTEQTQTSIPVIATATPVPIERPQPITCSDDDCLNACLERIQKALPQGDPIVPLEGAYANSEVDMNLVYYNVTNGQLGEPQNLYVPDSFKVYQQDTAAQQRAWDYASAMLPPDELKWIVKYEIFTSTYYAAWVQPDREDRSRWVLGMDLEDARDPLDLTIILAHEFGHVITLNSDQIPASDYYYGWYQNPAICAQFLNPDGCSKPESYINLFYQNFWKSLFDEWLNDVSKPQVNSPDEFRNLVQMFYEKHSESFVRSYAATNIYEDMAESFEHFVLEPKPTGDSVVEQKIRFYYDFPELIDVRKQMIQNVCSYTQ